MNITRLTTASSAAVNAEGREIFLRDIWPTREETQAIEKTFVIPSMFKEVYEKIEVMEAPRCQ